MDKLEKLLLVLLVISFLWTTATAKQPTVILDLGEVSPCEELVPSPPRFSPDVYVMPVSKALTISPKVF